MDEIMGWSPPSASSHVPYNERIQKLEKGQVFTKWKCSQSAGWFCTQCVPWGSYSTFCCPPHSREWTRLHQHKSKAGQRFGLQQALWHLRFHATLWHKPRWGAFKRYKGFTGYWILLTSSIETPQVRPGASQSSFTKCKILEATHSGLLLIILWSMGSCFQFIFAPTVLNNSLVFSNWESCIKTRCQSSVFLNTNPHA